MRTAVRAARGPAGIALGVPAAVARLLFPLVAGPPRQAQEAQEALGDLREVAWLGVWPAGASRRLGALGAGRPGTVSPPGRTA